VQKRADAKAALWTLALIRFTHPFGAACGCLSRYAWLWTPHASAMTATQTSASKQGERSAKWSITWTAMPAWLVEAPRPLSNKVPLSRGYLKCLFCDRTLIQSFAASAQSCFMVARYTMPLATVMVVLMGVLSSRLHRTFFSRPSARMQKFPLRVPT
jgi:hypothetical protein